MTRAASKHAAAPATGPRTLTVAIEDIPVGVNHMYANITRTSKSGKRYTGRRLTDAAVGWRTGAIATIKLAAGRTGFTVGRRTRLAIEITYGLPDLWQRDLDGCIKETIDALAHALAWDDRYALDLVLRKRKTENAETLITVMKLEA